MSSTMFNVKSGVHDVLSHWSIYLYLYLYLYKYNVQPPYAEECSIYVGFRNSVGRPLSTDTDEEAV